MADREPLNEPSPAPPPKPRVVDPATSSDEPKHQVLYLVHDATMTDGRVGLGVFSTLDRARRACRAQGGAPLVSIRAALVDGAVAFAQDLV